MPPIRGPAYQGRSRTSNSRAPMPVPYSQPLRNGSPDEIHEIPDDDDIEIVAVRPSIQTPQTARHHSESENLPRPGIPSRRWRKTSCVPELGFREGDVVKLSCDDDYIEIQEILRHVVHPDLIVVHALRYRRLSKMPGSFDRERNEVALIQEIFHDSIPNAAGRYPETFTIGDINTGIKKGLRKTNVLRSQGHQNGRMTEFFIGQGHEQPTDEGLLTCRLTYIARYDGPSSSRNPRKVEEAWENFTETDADPGHKVEDRLYRMQRKEIHRSLRRRFNGGEIEPTPEGMRRKYTACDGFCGAGFATAGAKMAGLQVEWSFDHDPKALYSYRKNHHDVKSLLMSFFDVVRQYGERIKVDVLMLSFPCQFFSPAHTRPGRNDDANEVAMLGLGDILAKVKPRLVVIEQTSGMHAVRFRQHLMAVIAGFRNNDYSVRKGVINFAGLGIASQRRRLIFIGAAPGEALPPLPRPEYSTRLDDSTSGLHPMVSIADVLSRVVASHPEHDFGSTRLSYPVPPIDPRITQLGTFTCGRNRKDRHNLHWRGDRYWTIHELLLLQGAPVRYRLGGSHATKVRQIGNAFPSIAAEKIYRECVRSLAATDDEDDRLDGLACSQVEDESPSIRRLARQTDEVIVLTAREYRSNVSGPGDEHQANPGASPGEAITIDDEDDDMDMSEESDSSEDDTMRMDS